jgi:hypothetical protein
MNGRGFMKYILCFLINLVLLQVVVAHRTTITRIINNNGVGVAIPGTGKYDSDQNDSPGVCFGSGVQHANCNNPGNLPRCHSEFFAIRAVFAANPNLNGFEITMEQSSYYPCETTCAKQQTQQHWQNPPNLNPGTTCDQYLDNFANQHGCVIYVYYYYDGELWYNRYS